MPLRFVLISRWQLNVPAQRLWDLITDYETWPRWWPNVVAVRQRKPGDADGLGAVNEFDWRSGLGYGFTLSVETVRVKKLVELEGSAQGDLRGTGLWVLEPIDSESVRVTYRWDVELQKPWMRLFAPLLHPVFAWRHFAVMARGAHGMARHLGCAVSELEERSFVTSARADATPETS
jgi:uncharacterized protein YndB with AHSA1/START domain